MNQRQIFFHTNIRLLRDRRDITQEECAQELGITRIKLAALESGRTENPTAIDLINFSEYFGISIDSLFKVDMSNISEANLLELVAGNDVYITGRNLRVLSITLDKDNKENMEYVPVKAKAGYRAGYNDPEFLAALPKFTLPNLPKGGTYRMFPTKGDSMLPIPEGCDVIGRFSQDWQNIKAKTLCIVILKGEQDFVFKQVSLQGAKLLLQSLNPLYEPYTVALSDVLEIWTFHCYQSKEIPQVTGDLQTVLKAITEVRNDIQAIRTV